MKTKYAVLCVLGAVLPYWFFVPWVAKNGLDMSLFFHQLFASRIGGFFCDGCAGIRHRACRIHSR